MKKLLLSVVTGLALVSGGAAVTAPAQAAPAPAPKWGAIAVSSLNGVAGMVRNRETKQAATDEAIAVCDREITTTDTGSGLPPHDCTVAVVVSSGSCMSLAKAREIGGRNRSVFSWASAATQLQADLDATLRSYGLFPLISLSGCQD
ncbi:DUF4189 domain-containing protein [Nocardia thailandica]